MFFSDEIQQYTVPFMGSDPSVVKRTQRYLVEEHQAAPVSFLMSPKPSRAAHSDWWAIYRLIAEAVVTSWLMA